MTNPKPAPSGGCAWAVFALLFAIVGIVLCAVALL